VVVAGIPSMTTSITIADATEAILILLIFRSFLVHVCVHTVLNTSY
jgi:hypothetical protein